MLIARFKKQNMRNKGQFHSVNHVNQGNLDLIRDNVMPW